MKFPSTIQQTNDGQWVLRHQSHDLGSVQVTAPTREEAMEKMIGELRYRLELCPCSGESYQYISIELVES